MEKSAIVPSSIRNKHKREDVYAKQKQEKSKAKLEKRLKRKREEENDPEKKKERLKNNAPKTLENTRELDDTIVGDDEEVMDDEDTDEFASYFNGLPPKLLITTSIGPSKPCYEFANSLLSIFPNSEFVKRGTKFSISQICEFAKQRGYTDMMVINDDKKIPNALTLIHLPEGPTAHFKLTSIVHQKDIRGHGRETSHTPELILNNFNTRLGHTIGRMFAALFPHVPQFQGRQVATFHNQRDFIFFRRSRYVFKNQERVDLQELGPRFTLKLKSLQKGTFDAKNGEYEWKFKQEMETSRRKFFL